MVALQAADRTRISNLLVWIKAMCRITLQIDLTVSGKVRPTYHKHKSANRRVTLCLKVYFQLVQLMAFFNNQSS